jgi:hypothetical protein
MMNRSVLLAALLFGVAADVRACSVPVFRYALDRWPADAYEVIVFHRGALKAEERALVTGLTKSVPSEGGLANVEVQMVDLDNDPPPSLKTLWEAQTDAALPWMVVRYPAAVRRDETVWATRLTAKSVERLLDSPIRRALARLIRGGETGVWLLLECGDKEKDDAAAERVRKELKRMPQVLKLPDLKKDDPEDRLAAGPELRISFTLLRLSRTDPAEQALVQMLLHSEKDLAEYSAEPMAFPIFGRGRADYALVGKGIVPQNVEEACARLVGPCTCQVKRQYPGIDLLIRTEWTAPREEVKPKDSAVVEQPKEKTGPDEEVVAAADSRLNSLLLVLGLGVAATVGAMAALGWWRRWV